MYNCCPLRLVHMTAICVAETVHNAGRPYNRVCGDEHPCMFYLRVSVWPIQNTIIADVVWEFS